MTATTSTGTKGNSWTGSVAGSRVSRMSSGVLVGSCMTILQEGHKAAQIIGACFDAQMIDTGPAEGGLQLGGAGLGALGPGAADAGVGGIDGEALAGLGVGEVDEAAIGRAISRRS